MNFADKLKAEHFTLGLITPDWPFENSFYGEGEAITIQETRDELVQRGKAFFQNHQAYEKMMKKKPTLSRQANFYNTAYQRNFKHEIEGRFIQAKKLLKTRAKRASTKVARQIMDGPGTTESIALVIEDLIVESMGLKRPALTA